MTLRIWMWSVSPGTPGLRQQMPRTKRLISVPALEAAINADITTGSFMELTFSQMRPALPSLAWVPICRTSQGRKSLGEVTSALVSSTTSPFSSA